jgi:hypothetical protein
MKWRISVAIIAVLCLCMLSSFSLDQAKAQGKKAAALVAEKITVLNPLGTPPPIKLKPMAPRLDALDGKTIYLIDNGYLGSDILLKEMIIWLEKEYPKTNFIFKRLGSGTGAGSQPLLAEIKDKADAVIMGVGH